MSKSHRLENVLQRQSFRSVTVFLYRLSYFWQQKSFGRDDFCVVGQRHPHYDSVVSKASKPHKVRSGKPLKPAAVATIKRGRGILKRKSGDEPFAEQWAEHKREENALEEAKSARCNSGSG